jgi:CRP/FNR family cyclic AMP-dependent transcriptional regulator
MRGTPPESPRGAPGAPGGQPNTVRVLEHDPDLTEGLPSEGLDELRRAAVAIVLTHERGTWPLRQQLGAQGGSLGLLVLDGLLTRNVRLAGTTATELLGPGELLRPWDDDEFLSVPVEAWWTVLEPTRLALLDRRFLAATARCPALAGNIVGRYVRRSRWLMLQLALHHHRRVDTRLLVLFWNMADRFGRMTRAGVVLPTRLKHELLGSLVGAQRPSVTTALGTLAERGLVQQIDGGGWLLHGEDPRESLSSYLEETSSG